MGVVDRLIRRRRELDAGIFRRGEVGYVRYKNPKVRFRLPDYETYEKKDLLEGDTYPLATLRESILERSLASILEWEAPEPINLDIGVLAVMRLRSRAKRR